MIWTNNHNPEEKGCTGVFPLEKKLSWNIWFLSGICPTWKKGSACWQQTSKRKSDKCKPITGGRSRKIIDWFSNRSGHKLCSSTLLAWEQQRWTVSPATWAVIQVFTGKLTNLRREALSLECIPVSSAFEKLHLEFLHSLIFVFEITFQTSLPRPRGDRHQSLRRRLPHRRCSGHQLLPGTSCDFEWGYHWEIVEVSWDMVISWGNDGEMMGASWIYNLQDLGVRSQDPSDHPTGIGNFQWGETKVKPI